MPRVADVKPLPTIFALLTGVAGWFYLFYSQAAHRLSGIEDKRLNRRRVRLRRAGGVVMLALAVLFYAGFHTVDPQNDPNAFVTVWLCVFVLLAMIIVLALLDMRLTYRLRASRRRQQHPE